MVVMQVFLHLFLVLGKCNRVTTRVRLIFGVFFTLGLLHSHHSLSSFSLSSGLGILSGYTLGFLFGLKFDKPHVAALAAFLCLGLWRRALYYFQRASNDITSVTFLSLSIMSPKGLVLMTCSPWWPPWRISQRRRCSCPLRRGWAWYLLHVLSVKSFTS